jgi:hypothetical protein
MSNIKSQLENGKCFLPTHDKANNAAASLAILRGKVFNHFICASDFRPAASLTYQIALSKMRLRFGGV